MINFGIKKAHPEAYMPTRGSQEAACFDLYVDEDTILWPFCGKLVKAGVIFDTPKGYVVEVYLRSSMCKRGIHGSTGIVDSDFRGEVRVQATSIRPWPIFLKKGDRIGQARLVKLEDYQLVETTSLRRTERGENGWGSTGK